MSFLLVPLYAFTFTIIFLGFCMYKNWNYFPDCYPYLVAIIIVSISGSVLSLVYLPYYVISSIKDT